MRVALDLEEVLADTISEACRSTEKLDQSDFEEWDLNDYTWQVYSGVSDALWRHDPMSIPPVEPDLDLHTSSIHSSVDQLDIVTARLHVDNEIETWLSWQQIAYDDIVSTSRPKYELDYDVFIDDNPEMFNECRLLLVDHEHNESVDDETSKSCDRIYSLSEAREFIRD
jgi:hypothetical protein